MKFQVAFLITMLVAVYAKALPLTKPTDAATTQKPKVDPRLPLFKYTLFQDEEFQDSVMPMVNFFKRRFKEVIKSGAVDLKKGKVSSDVSTTFGVSVPSNYPSWFICFLMGHC
ncbi:uncharacterized protein LOC130623484 [Hydractinia symbiolongicarpus]|uniref:uncharacterized protein LOC130623484 n=1 Tax=Hydractinia symbiolongicarpus TaxID=13093 RepID=UPI00254EEB98|nr:uncharacterized protein LOC130623484 [Hydractinia symbiolongicarpus]